MNAAAPIRAAGPALRPALGPDWLPLLRELGDLKRVRSAGQEGSIAERLFRHAWRALAEGAEPEQVMRSIVARALAAARLGDLDREKLHALGLRAGDVHETLRHAFDEVAGPLDADLADLLRDGLAIEAVTGGEEPHFVALLAAQPRAGVTCPGRPRLLLQPPENHAEHCLMVAVYGMLFAPVEDADPTAVFLAGLSHHFHNALIPDSGFTGEMLLGVHLQPVIARARAAALAPLASALRAQVEAALAPIAGDDTPDARAFHAADVLDRVLEIEQHLRATRATMGEVLDDYELVHAGPVKRFHDQVLWQVGLT
jgi:5'-deoxynucleotidase YfbR-like HD superfamily hydrolase